MLVLFQYSICSDLKVPGRLYLGHQNFILFGQGWEDYILSLFQRVLQTIDDRKLCVRASRKHSLSTVLRGYI